MYHGAETENRCHHNLYTETHFALQIPNITSRGVFRVLEDFWWMDGWMGGGGGVDMSWKWAYQEVDDFHGTN